MITLTPYLLFEGRCLEAMEFYRSCFGGDLALTKIGDSFARDHMPAAMHDRVLNARLVSGKVEISASDWMRPDQTAVRGNTVCLFLNSDSREELAAIFAKLSDGADVTDPLREMPFGTYGALNDKFGVRWMVRAEKPRN